MADGEARARQVLALFLAEQYAELIARAAAKCEARGEPLTPAQRSILLAVGWALLKETR